MIKRVWCDSLAWCIQLTLTVLGAFACVSLQAVDLGSPLAKRIVSLDYCADQYVLQFADRRHILALSPDSKKPFSYLREKAQGIPQIRSLAEDVLIARPDLVVRSYGGGPNALRFFERSGVPVLQVGFTNDLAGIKRVTADMAAGLGVPARGVALVADIERRLLAINTDRRGRSARGANSQSVLYMTSGGATTGPGTLIHEMFMAAGLRNFQEQPGWRSLPLERLAYERPDRLALARFNTANGTAGDSAGSEDLQAPNPWSVLRHPIAQAQLDSRPTTYLNGAWTSCGAWFLLDAIEALAQ